MDSLWTKQDNVGTLAVDGQQLNKRWTLNGRWIDIWWQMDRPQIDRSVDGLSMYSRRVQMKLCKLTVDGQKMDNWTWTVDAQ